MTSETTAPATHMDTDEAIDLDLMWLHSIALELRAGRDPMTRANEIDDIARGIASYLRVMRSENETMRTGLARAKADIEAALASPLFTKQAD